MFLTIVLFNAVLCELLTALYSELLQTNLSKIKIESAMLLESSPHYTSESVY